MPERRRGIAVEGRGVVGSEKGRRGKRKVLHDLCTFIFVCLFVFPPLTHAEPMKEYFKYGI